jgi:hypothetical protein
MHFDPATSRPIEAVVRIVRRVILMPRARSTTIVREVRVSVPRVSFLEVSEVV